MIELRNITIRAGQFLLENVCLKAEAGKFHVLLGPSGSGKTLLLETIAGLIMPTSGEIYLSEKLIHKIPSENRNISYLPQDNALFPNKNVFENIAFGLKLKKQFSNATIEEKVNDMASKLNVSHLLSRSVINLSGGEQQRVALARALVVNTPILLLDEPTSSLHESMQEDFCLLLKKLQKEYKLTVLMTTHHKDSAFLVADSLHFVDKGTIRLSANIQTIYQSLLPKNIAHLLGVSNFFTLSTANQNNQFYCEELKTTFAFTQKTIENTTFSIGVKPENIRVIKEEDIHNKYPNRFVAEVEEMLFKENDTLVLLKVPETSFRLKMQLTTYNQKKLNISVGKLLHCKIKEEYISFVY
ncbi:MAG: ABC transporter ATP-binding protein [Bacteroidetes bacterium]|nr:ABC transporter ATP-binding protein [Bacteroidota bacterium]MBV6461386.1 Vitamin B12 import ATP-binding protein BtuD [Flavobacteriales bacterium]WKZ75213.1 MAG: ABC transporter ATP-binding protein [Vicingaceae bacterium]MCL4817438.1 ABC transporter ATP-binding protein [Flavobacteriales bacterium]NOG96102.1 ABC transporter ATP-binding protein [Bacteroidota bacterium]